MKSAPSFTRAVGCARYSHLNIDPMPKGPPQALQRDDRRFASIPTEKALVCAGEARRHMSVPSHRGNIDLEQALAEAREQYAARRPESARIHREARKVLPGGNTRS